VVRCLDDEEGEGDEPSLRREMITIEKKVFEDLKVSTPV
jgi:hypothetical protein